MSRSGIEHFPEPWSAVGGVFAGVVTIVVWTRNWMSTSVGSSDVAGNSLLGTSRPFLDCSFNLPKKCPTIPCILRRPELLEDLERVQGLRF